MKQVDEKEHSESLKNLMDLSTGYVEDSLIELTQKKPFNAIYSVLMANFTIQTAILRQLLHLTSKTEKIENSLENVEAVTSRLDQMLRDGWPN